MSTTAKPEGDLTAEALAPLRVENGFAHITLNRPQRGNALSAELVKALDWQTRRAIERSDVHSLVIEAAGANFCTGFDLSDLDAMSEGDLLERFVRVELLLDAIWRCPLRTIAITQGRCWGAGADLFAACDVRIAQPGSSYRFPGAGFGIVLGSSRLAHRVGSEQARQWISEGTAIDTAQALSTRLANRLADPRPDHDPSALTTWVTQWLPADVAIDRATLTASRQATAPAGILAQAQADADLAALVRSATREGLKARILAYRNRTLKRAAEPQDNDR